MIWSFGPGRAGRGRGEGQEQTCLVSLVLWCQDADEAGHLSHQFILTRISFGGGSGSRDIPDHIGPRIAGEIDRTLLASPLASPLGFPVV